MEQNISISFEYIAEHCKTIADILSLEQNLAQNGLKCENKHNLEGLQ